MISCSVHLLPAVTALPQLAASMPEIKAEAPVSFPFAGSHYTVFVRIY
jgi:hypothetical protein